MSCMQTESTFGPKVSESSAKFESRRAKSLDQQLTRERLKKVKNNHQRKKGLVFRNFSLLPEDQFPTKKTFLKLQVFKHITIVDSSS